MLRLKSLLKSGITGGVSSTISDDTAESSTREILLFVTKTCPNCKKAKTLLQKSGVSFTEIAVEDNPELALELDLRQAPSLVVRNKNDTETVAGISNIKKYLEVK